MCDVVTKTTFHLNAAVQITRYLHNLRVGKLMSDLKVPLSSKGNSMLYTLLHVCALFSPAPVSVQFNKRCAFSLHCHPISHYGVTPFLTTVSPDFSLWCQPISHYSVNPFLTTVSPHFSLRCHPISHYGVTPFLTVQCLFSSIIFLRLYCFYFSKISHISSYALFIPKTMSHSVHCLLHHAVSSVLAVALCNSCSSFLAYAPYVHVAVFWSMHRTFL